MQPAHRDLIDIAAINARYDRACIGLWLAGAILIGISWSLDAGEMVFSVATLLVVAHRMLHPWIQHRYFPRTASSKVAFWLLAGCILCLLAVLLLCARHYQHTHPSDPGTARTYHAAELARPPAPEQQRSPSRY